MVSVELIFPISREVFLTIADSMMQVLATLAGVEASAVTVSSITVYGSSRRLLQESSIIVVFSIQLSPGATTSQIANVETSLNTQNIAAAIASSSDTTLKSTLPNGVIVYTVQPVVQPVDSSEVVEDGISLILVLIVSAVCVVIAIGIAVVISCKCRSAANKARNQPTTSNVQFKMPQPTLPENSNVHRDEDLFRVIPFPYARADATIQPIMRRDTPRILDYDMLSI